MASRKTKVAFGLGVLLAASFAIHYALFGALPLGKPTMLDDE
ncbi:hypothetical protein [Halococcus sp. IIIV-5B]|nr:hypothetical protein [Halococcus sp. IIIV-5B]